MSLFKILTMSVGWRVVGQDHRDGDALLLPSAQLVGPVNCAVHDVDEKRPPRVVFPGPVEERGGYALGSLPQKEDRQSSTSAKIPLTRTCLGEQDEMCPWVPGCGLNPPTRLPLGGSWSSGI